MTELIEHLGRTFHENSSLQWLVALGIFLGVLAAGVVARRVARRRYAAMAATEELELLEVPFELASKTTSAFLVVLSLYLALSTLSLAPPLAKLVVTAFTIASFWQLGAWASSALLTWLLMRRRATAAVDRAAVGSLGIIGFLLRMLVWTLVLLLTLDNLGIDITALVAGLGVGGIAVALAVQNVLGDLFASLSITLDRPFVVGDHVTVGEYAGTVEQIGIKSTRLRSLGGEQIILANADLLSSRVRNYGRMTERRVVFSIGVSYETPRDKLQQIPELMRAIIGAQKEARFGRSHFSSYGEQALHFETVYHVLSADFGKYMDIQQAINFGVHEAFEREGIEFAYQTARVWTASGERSLARRSAPPDHAATIDA